MPLTTGQILNSRYRIVKLLGQGGFGAVYKAWDLNFNLPCAVKENLDTTAAAQRQFEREARLLRTLHHSSLPQVIDHFILPGQGQYLVMDFIEGEDLQSMLDHQGALPESKVLAWTAEVCDALNYMHSQNPAIIHRDIKPANIKITPQGQATLVDFGIAKVFDAALKTTLGAQAVTPGYSPPEQYGQGVTDRRSDIYALGATLYACLTGQQPIESVQRIMGKPLTQPRSINPAISPEAEAIILKAVEVRPESRFQTAAELKAAINAPRPPSPATAETVVVQGFKPTQVVVLTPASSGGAYAAGVPFAAGLAPAAATVAAAPPEVAKAPAAAFPWKSILIGLIVVVLLAAGGIGGYAMLARSQATATPTRTEKPTKEIAFIPSETPLLPTSTPTSQPTPVPTNTEAATLASTSTSIPIPAATPTPEPSLAPTATLAPAPSLVIGGADKIAYLNNNDVWMANLDGSELTQLTKDGAAKTYLRWTPDGQALTYISGKCIQKVNIIDDQAQPVTCFNNSENLESFEISPDGQNFALSLDHLLYILPNDLTILSQVNSHDGLKGMAGCPAFAPYQRNLVRYTRWSSDSQKVAAVAMIPLPDGRRGDVVTVFAVDRCIPGPAYEDIFPGPSRFEISTYNKNPVIQNLGWDGLDLFALTGYTRNEGFGDLYVYNMTTHKAKNQINPIKHKCCYRDPQWSPDGNYLVFAFQDYSQGANSKTQLYLVRYGDIESGAQFTPLPLPDITNPLEKPQPVLRPIQK